ncbi:MAG: hypothetical protein R3C32_00940 [Chloroflexota bacterium]
MTPPTSAGGASPTCSRPIVHNDYVSGALEVRAMRDAGAEIVVPARGGYRFPHRAADEGAAAAVGAISLVAMATPGHTPEHLACRCWTTWMARSRRC